MLKIQFCHNKISIVIPIIFLILIFFSNNAKPQGTSSEVNANSWAIVRKAAIKVHKYPKPGAPILRRIKRNTPIRIIYIGEGKKISTATEGYTNEFWFGIKDEKNQKGWIKSREYDSNIWILDNKFIIVKDIDQDGKKEIISIAWENFVVGIDQKTGNKIFSYLHTGIPVIIKNKTGVLLEGYTNNKEYEYWPKAFNRCECGVINSPETLKLIDINNDGFDEIITKNISGESDGETLISYGISFYSLKRWRLYFLGRFNIYHPLVDKFFMSDKGGGQGLLHLSAMDNLSTNNIIKYKIWKRNFNFESMNFPTIRHHTYKLIPLHFYDLTFIYKKGKVRAVKKNNIIYGKIAGHNVRMREKPTVSNSRILYLLKKNEKIVIHSHTEIIDKIGNNNHVWYRIQYKGKKGYIFGKYMIFTDRFLNKTYHLHKSVK